MADNLRHWNALGKTNPAHTKPFKRAGGFSGTAIKPIWITKMLTEHFGPAGEGWGVNEPCFEVVPADSEVLVYCTVSAWHGDRSNLLWGVGGDKVLARRKDGTAFTDDEAFKKAFTDAVNNAFKSIGVGADVHMGQFDDDKYVRETRQDFAEAERKAAPPPELPGSVKQMMDGLRDAAANGEVAMADYWKQHWPGVPREHRPVVQAFKEQLKTANGQVAMLRAG